jgi:hypothetical protein
MGHQKTSHDLAKLLGVHSLARINIIGANPCTDSDSTTIHLSIVCYIASIVEIPTVVKFLWLWLWESTGFVPTKIQTGSYTWKHKVTGNWQKITGYHVKSHGVTWISRALGTPRRCVLRALASGSAAPEGSDSGVSVRNWDQAVSDRPWEWFRVEGTGTNLVCLTFARVRWVPLIVVNLQ